MSSRREVANRANAAKSTGPRSDAGKARSSRNAITHGLSSIRTLIPGENPLELHQLEEGIASQYVQNPLTRALCVRYAGLLWRLSRIRRLESGAMSCSLMMRFAYEQPLEDGDVYHPDQVFDEYSASSSGSSIGTCLGWDAKRLLKHLETLSRYEVLLFGQLVKLAKMLEPYAIHDEGDDYGLDNSSERGSSRTLSLIDAAAPAPDIIEKQSQR